jgi:hypothetical protein
MPVPVARSINIEINEEQLNAVRGLVKEFGKKGSKPLVWAINKTMTGSATARGTGGLIKDSVDEMAKYINLQKNILKTGPHSPGHKVSKENRLWHVEKATMDNIAGKLACTSKNIKLIHYSNQRGKKKAYAKSIFVQVLKERNKKKLKSAFIPKLKSGHIGLFTRVKETDAISPRGKQAYRKTRKGKSKIRELYGARISDFYSNTPMLDEIIMKKASERLDKNLNHEIDYFMDKMNKEAGGKK